MSTLPCLRSSASVTEKPLDTLISILGNSSLRIRVARGKPCRFLSGQEADGENRLRGRAARRAASAAASTCINARRA